MAKLFSMKYLRWFGNMSYSYYLVHGLVIQAVIIIVNKYGWLQQIESFYIFIIFGIIVFFCSLIPAILLFLFIEKPYSINDTLLYLQCFFN